MQLHKKFDGYPYSTKPTETNKQTKPSTFDDLICVENMKTNNEYEFQKANVIWHDSIFLS